MGNNQNDRGNMGNNNMGQGSGQRQEGQAKDTGTNTKSVQPGQGKQDDHSQDKKPGTSAPPRDDSSSR